MMGKRQKGIGIIEVLIGTSLIAIVFFSFLVLSQYSLRLQSQNKAKLEAINIAIETIEAARSFRNEGWDGFFVLLQGTPYYPVISDNRWILEADNPGLINGKYNRWLIIESVLRDTNDDISDSGIEDDQTRKVTAFVQWQDRGQIKEISLNTYLTNWEHE